MTLNLLIKSKKTQNFLKTNNSDYFNLSKSKKIISVIIKIRKKIYNKMNN